MKYKFYVQFLMILILVTRCVYSNENPLPILNSTNENIYSHVDNTGEHDFSSSTVSENIPKTNEITKTNNVKSHHHEKHKIPINSVNSRTRSPVYEIVNQPCYSLGCGKYAPQEGLTRNRWKTRRNRYGPYTKPATRRRGGYGYPRREAYRDFYPQSDYGPSYGYPYPDYGYDSRGPMPLYPQDRYDHIGGYTRQSYEDYFLG